MTLRLPCAPLKPVNLAIGSLFFSDGSQKTLGAFIVWIALCLAAGRESNQGTFGNDANVQALLGSLLRIRTVLKGSSGSSDDLDSAVARIVKQNLDSKVQPVSSLAWCSILTSVCDGSTGSFDSAMAKYNAHPEVRAMDSSGGAGPISLDNRKKQARYSGNRWCVCVCVSVCVCGRGRGQDAKDSAVRHDPKIKTSKHLDFLMGLRSLRRYCCGTFYGLFCLYETMETFLLSLTRICIEIEIEIAARQ